MASGGRGVQTFERGTEAEEKDRFTLGFSPERTADTEGLFQRRHYLPTHPREELDGRLFDEGVFVITIRHCNELEGA